MQRRGVGVERRRKKRPISRQIVAITPRIKNMG
jgi:hypothetical protein